MAQMAQTDLGNTKARSYVITINNFTEDEEKIVQSYHKYTYQIESGTENTTHLQGVITFKNARSFNAVKKELPRAHIEKCKRLKFAISYCMKEETRIRGPYSTHVKIKPPLKDLMENKELYEWQKQILEILKSEPDERRIDWFWSKSGCEGKTIFVKHILMNNKNATFIGGGDNKSALYSLKTRFEENPEINAVLMNIPRCKSRIPYNALEQVKDGLVFCEKYESGYFMFNNPHLIIMANEPPNKSKMSQDRWNIIRIDESDNEELSEDEYLE